MENIIALAIVVGVLALFIWGTVTLIKRVKREQAQEAERRAKADAYWADQRKKKVPESMQRYASALGAAPSMPPPKPQKTESFSREMDYVKPETRRSDSSDDGFLTGALVGYAVNSLLHSGNSNASEERSVGVRSSESSWGMDDSDSRSSISSSMNTSSSWSSSDFGSSDSGPSSDW